MKSLNTYLHENVQIFELRDETYLAAAAKRRSKGENVIDLLMHSADMGIKKFVKEIQNFDWFDKYVVKEKMKIYERNSLYIEFIDAMHTFDKDFDKSVYEKIDNDLRTLCKKNGKLVHGLRFYLQYSNEAPNVVISFLNRSNPIDTKKTATLFHVTTKKDAIDSIIANGLCPQEKNNFSTYTYSCVFALTNKAGIKEYVKLLSEAKSSGYYVISFKAGDNIYFDDLLQNHHFRMTSNASRDWSGTACFTLTDILPEQIVSIDYYKGNKIIENIYTRK